MIKTKKELKEYLLEDKKALSKAGKPPRFYDYIWRFEVLLRKTEYYYNNRDKFFCNPMYFFYKYLLHRLKLKTGFNISINCIGKGLNIAHIGPITINNRAKIGDYCRIHTCVNIGTAAGTTDQVPVIGNHCYIGPGAKIFGAINIGDDVAIGANAVVNKSFPNHVTIVGVPAKVISDKGSIGLCYDGRKKIK